MAQAVTVYRWDDVGAPQLTNGSPSEIINVLRKCLVDGYGSKSSLGWVILKEDTANQKIAFKNNAASGGSGNAVQIHSHNGSNAAETLLRVNVCQTLLDWDLYTNQGFQKYIHVKSSWTNWFIIGTPTGFYFIAGSPTAGLAGQNKHDEFGLFVGDISAAYNNESLKMIALSGDFYAHADQNKTAAFGWSFGFNHAFAVYQKDSSSSVKLYDLDASGIGTSFRVQPFVFDESRDTPTASVCEHYAKVELYRKPLANGGFRGQVPGIIHALVPNHGNSDGPWPLITSIAGQQHLAVRSNNGSVKLYINLEQWDAA